jgi:hypothetical protein
VVTTTAAGTRIEADPATSATAGDAARGWYLYGITRRGLLAAVLAEADAGNPVGAGPTAATSDAVPLQLLECCGLAAVVRPVLLADFSLDVLQERLQRASELEAMVRSHNHVIEAIHARQAILPAKFGVVYAHARDILSALRSACDTLLPQLHRLEGCDEWALHLYADRAVVRERIAARIPAIGRLREEHAAARPGRAYFLERQLRDEQDAATRQALVSLAQSAFDRMAGAAVAGQVNPVGPVADAAGEVEILRAAFLVARDGAERFEAEVRSAADASEGLRCERSGPWPPYSFAAVDREAEEAK